MVWYMTQVYVHLSYYSSPIFKVVLRLFSTLSYRLLWIFRSRNILFTMSNTIAHEQDISVGKSR
jgi:hypothetical protein